MSHWTNWANERTGGTVIISETNEVRRTGGGVPYPKYYQFTRRNAHEVWAVRNVETLPACIRDYLRPFNAGYGDWRISRVFLFPRLPPTLFLFQKY